MWPLRDLVAADTEAQAEGGIKIIPVADNYHRSSR
jgi:hypothetical protein